MNYLACLDGYASSIWNILNLSSNICKVNPNWFYLIQSNAQINRPSRQKTGTGNLNFYRIKHMGRETIYKPGETGNRSGINKINDLSINESRLLGGSNNAQKRHAIQTVICNKWRDFYYSCHKTKFFGLIAFIRLRFVYFRMIVWFKKINLLSW